MKSFKKIITTAIAGIMAAASLATTAGAAEYFGNDGTYWFDGIYDGKVYTEDAYGNYRELDDCRYDKVYNDYYNSRYTEVYAGNDVYYGDIYYRTDIGYYTYTSNGMEYFGQDFTFTEYVGKDTRGRTLYYRSEFGYIYYNTNACKWYTLGYNVRYVR